MAEQREKVPVPFSERTYSGTFNVRIGEGLHRDLVVHAAEDGLSLNQYVVKKLASAWPQHATQPTSTTSPRSPCLDSSGCASSTPPDPTSKPSKNRVLRLHGKGDKVALTPLPPAVSRAIDKAIAGRACGPILRSRTGARMDRHSATRRLRALALAAGVSTPRMHPHMLRHTFVTTMLEAGVDLRAVQIAARPADPRTTMRYDRARKNLDRHPNYILAAYMASGTWVSTKQRAQSGM